VRCLFWRETRKVSNGYDRPGRQGAVVFTIVRGVIFHERATFSGRSASLLWRNDVSKITPDGPVGLDVAIVGMGPRGLSVLERLLVQLARRPAAGQVRIWTFDPGEPGAGRIWRTTQSEWFMMNTAAGEVRLYSGGPDGRNARAGAGPSLAEWLRQHPDHRWASLGPNDYAPRSVYGEYLHSVYGNLVANAPDNVVVFPVKACVERIERYDHKRMLVSDQNGYVLVADKVVLATGHPRNFPDDTEQRFHQFAQRRPELRYLRGDSAAELPLDAIEPSEQVGIIGLGLTFFDVLMALTLGRGGKFNTRAGGELYYQASGREPHIVAGSRSGLIMPARGNNQKPPTYRYHPLFITESAITAARRQAQRRSGSAQLDFVRDVLPLLQLEVEHVYYTTHVRRRHGADAAAKFAARHQELADPRRQHVVDKLRTEFGIADVPPVDLEHLARPFHDEKFSDPADFHGRLLALLRNDLSEAVQGNVDGPLKAALDVLRDTRGSVRQAVDFAGLRPGSHRDDFLGWFNPINTMVSAGPPAIRVAQAGALIKSGTLTVVGPEMRVSCEESSDRFVLDSPRVRGSRQVVTTLIDARIPRPQLHRDSHPLMRQLVADGLVSEHINSDPLSGVRFRTGSIAVTRAPFHVIDADGKTNPHLYALGIPTENTRWFTQIGNGRPGPLSGFHVDADAIAIDVLASVGGQASNAPQHSGHDAASHVSLASLGELIASIAD
jgi:uncharacterized NAD(P)/FAD-binding protein YdhS